jgi:integrase
MPRKKLTGAGVARLNPPAKGKQIDYFDGIQRGLVLRVNYGGAKIWRVLHYVKRTKDGKRQMIPTTFKLGRYPELSVKQAREKALQFLADPQKALSKADAGTSFKDVAEDFIKRHVEGSKLRTQAEIERCIAKYVYPDWQHRPFREIKRGDVAALLDKVEDKHGKRQADIVLAIIRKIMNWYATRDGDYVSVVVRGMNRSNGADHSRKRILDDDEIRAVWNACAELGTFGALVKVLLLTAQRRAKVARMQWSDLVDGEWRIPSEAREKTHAGTLKLPQTVLGIVNAQPRVAGNPHVFGAASGTLTAFAAFSLWKAALDAKLPKLPHWTLHDLRRTARSLMSRASVRPDIAERMLGHAIPGVEGVYDRHSYAEEKADALQRLAHLVETIIHPPEGNVVALAHRERRSRSPKGQTVISPTP